MPLRVSSWIMIFSPSPFKLSKSSMTMNKYSTSVRLLFLLLSMLLMAGLATATELQCKVVEINSGDTISVVNGSGPMRVKLKAIAAPEMEQPWGDVARQHLSDLL